MSEPKRQQMSDQALLGGASDDIVREAHSCVDGATDGGGVTYRSEEPETATLDRIEDRARVVTPGSGRVGDSSLRALVREVSRQLVSVWGGRESYDWVRIE